MVGQNSNHTKSTRNARFNRRLTFFTIILGVVALLSLVASFSAYGLTSISQSYKTTDDLSVGSIVSLKAGTNDEVVASTNNNLQAMLGVVINDGSSILALESKETNTVQVATTEVISVLVSDINGAIKEGDQVTASPIKGVGMKATSNVKVIGVAQEDLVGSTTQKYTDSEGKEQTINLGKLKVLVNVAYFYVEPEKTLIPAAIQNIANALAGKTVNTLPILIGAAIFIVMIIIVVSIIYSMIHGGIISVGRNPLSQSAIYRDLIQLSALVLVILAAGMISIYLVLTRM